MKRIWLILPLTLVLAFMAWGSLGPGFRTMWDLWTHRTRYDSGQFAWIKPSSQALPRPAASPEAPAADVPDSVHSITEELKRIHKTMEGRRVLNPPHGDAFALVRELQGDPDRQRKTWLAAIRISRLMAECLLNHICNQGPEDGYFDPDNTPGNRILNKALQYVKAAATTANLPPPAFLLNNLRIQNPETQILSMELLVQEPPTPQLVQQILGDASLIHDQAKPVYFELMQDYSTDTTTSRGQFLNTYYQSLQTDDATTVTDTVAQMKDLTLTQGEFQQAIQQVCRFKSSPPVWQQIDAGLVSFEESQNYTNAPDPNQVCG